MPNEFCEPQRKWHSVAPPGVTPSAVARRAWLIAKSGDTEARHRAVQALVHAGRVDEAVIRLARGALVGEHGAFTSALFMLESAGRSAEAGSLRRSGWEADGTTSREWSAPPLPQPAEASAGYRWDRALP